MKILKVSFKNLNSLKGEWEIDFRKPEFSRDGIFLITGATGSGKTTILDAITLALYGKTPRQKSITQYNNEIMTKGTGNCFAEVIFKGKKGKVYRSRWSQRRARGKADGKLQKQVILLEEVNGKAIETNKIDAWRKKVENVSGLDFDRFIRSVLLAQGQFAIFLTSNEKQKSEILEKITGTEIYQQISKRVFYKKRDIERELESIKNSLDGIKPMSFGDREQTKKDIKKIEKELIILKEEKSEKSGILNKFAELKENKIKISELETTVRDIKREIHNSFKDKFIVENREKVTFLIRSCRDIKSWENKIKIEKREIESLEESLKKVLFFLEENSFLEGLTADKVKNIQKDLESIEVISEKERKNREKKDIYQSEIDILEKKYSNIFSGDEVGNIRNVESKIDSLKKERKKLREIVENGFIEKLEKEISNLEVIKLSQEIETLNKKLEKLKREYEKLMEQKSFTDLSKFRVLLKDNKPCPLCGSLTHCWDKRKYENSARNFDKKQLEVLTKKIDETLKSISKKEHKRETFLKTIGNSWTVDIDIKTVDDKINELNIEIKKLNDSREKILEIFRKIEILSNIKRLKEKIEDIEISEQELNKRKKEAQSRFAEIEKRVKNVDIDLNNENSILKDINNYVSKKENKKALEIKINLKKESLSDMEKDLNQKKNFFKSDLENSNIDSIDKLLELDISDAEFREIKNRVETLNNRLKSAEIEYKNRVYRVTELKLELRGYSSLEIKNRNRELEIKEQELLEERAEKSNSLRSDMDLKRKYNEVYKKYNEKSGEFKIWNYLHNMIGSSDGAKFAKFAQTLTMEYLLFFANRHLQKFNSRYQIAQKDILNEKSVLDLVIVDTYQANYKRALSTLSGGENFIVSLALSLGLSDLAGDNIKIETLFLDEGFGSLDTQTLESVLITLETLRGEERMIGVISHIESMKERILTQIEVKKDSSGIGYLNSRFKKK